ncbi:MAG TPA: NUDIX hydrolase [Patescibacteria group bacterium]|nr:NUDIX hydrolase [Patescibacteria group bacterium]
MKIPQQATKVFQGKIFSVYQWDQQMFDGSHETFEMIKRPDTIQILVTQGDKILLTRQSQPHKHDYFSLYGGRAEEGEEPLVTAKRELLEESGLESDDWELLTVCTPYTKIDWEIYYFIARDCKKIAEPHLDPGEKIEQVACTFEEFTSFVEKDDYLAKDLALKMMKMEKEGTLEGFRKNIFGLLDK